MCRKKPVLESLLIKLQAFRPATLLKRDPNTGVYLWILRNFPQYYFEEHLRNAASRWCSSKIMLISINPDLRSYHRNPQTKFVSCIQPGVEHPLMAPPFFVTPSH